MVLVLILASFHEAPVIGCCPHLPPRHITEPIVAHQSNHEATPGVDVPGTFFGSSRWRFSSRSKWFCAVLGRSGAGSRPDLGKLQYVKLSNYIFPLLRNSMHLLLLHDPPLCLITEGESEGGRTVATSVVM